MRNIEVGNTCDVEVGTSCAYFIPDTQYAEVDSLHGHPVCVCVCVSISTHSS